ncbi:MAG: Asd/ArgC dimerization domain-containing protein [Terracidiphilus sp.]|nr:Asd/ArgC dimerization domain-containing protein [Terracidiphilus sp.]
MYKIAIAGASTLLGQEVKDALAESPLATASVILLDEADARGQLEQVGDEIAVLQPIDDDAFERVDFTFFCGSEAMTQKYWKQALRSGSSVLDLSGTLDQETGVLVRSPWIGVELAADLFTPAVVPAHSAALALSILLERLRSAVPLRSIAATILQPASESGRSAMDELHEQTVKLLSFQGLPRDMFDAQIAYNLVTGLGESARVNLNATEARIRRHCEALAAGRWPQVAVQLIQAPVFHGFTFSVAVELERPVEIATLEESLGGDHVDLVLEDTDSPSNLAATGQSDVLVRLRAEREGRNPTLASRIWLWAASDNLRLSAQNAVACAMDLRRLRPAGTVQ